MKSVNDAVKTVLTISTGLLIVHFITKWEWPVIVSLVVGITGVIFPKMALKIDFVWKRLTKFVGIVIQRIVLILIFYIFLFPIALLFRLFTKNNPLQLSNNSSSTFVDEHKTFEKNGFEKPW